MGKMEGIFELFITMFKEIDGFKFFLQLQFFLVRNILERRAVLTKIQVNELHNALSAYYVATEMADNVDDILSVVLQLASLFEIALFPGFLDAYEATAVIVGCATNAALRAAHSQTGQNGFVLTVEHIVLVVLIAQATIVFVHTFKRVLDTCKIGDTAAFVNGFQKIVHRKETTVESGDVIEEERQIGCTGCNLFAISLTLQSVRYGGTELP